MECDEHGGKLGRALMVTLRAHVSPGARMQGADPHSIRDAQTPELDMVSDD